MCTPDLRPMMRHLLATLLAFPVLVFSAPCTTPPKAGLTTDQVLITITRVDGIDITNIIMAWPTADPALVCCSRAQYDRRAWQVILDQQIPRGVVTLTDFVMGITPPGPEKTEAENAICQIMADRILPPGQRVVRNTLRADGSRPLKVLRDPAQPYSATNPLIDLKVAGVTQYVEAGQPCERSPVINITGAGQWLYVRNLSGQRGIALCK